MFRERFEMLLPRLIPLVALVLILCAVGFLIVRPPDESSFSGFVAIGKLAVSLLLIAAGAGLASMATVQFWKLAFRPRANFHHAQLAEAFPESMMYVVGALSPMNPSQNWKDFDSAELLARDLLDNPTEVLMGQIRSSADFVLMNPFSFERAVLFELAGRGSKETVLRFLDSAGIESEANKHVSMLRFLIDQRLNLLHVRMRDRWRRRVRWIAAGVAAAIGLLTIAFVGATLEALVAVVFATLVWGGFFAWFARDLVAILERRRA